MCGFYPLEVYPRVEVFAETWYCALALFHLRACDENCGPRVLRSSEWISYWYLCLNYLTEFWGLLSGSVVDIYALFRWRNFAAQRTNNLKRWFNPMVRVTLIKIKFVCMIFFFFSYIYFLRRGCCGVGNGPWWDQDM